jgi:hypothetical protein
MKLTKTKITLPIKPIGPHNNTKNIKLMLFIDENKGQVGKLPRLSK